MKAQMRYLSKDSIKILELIESMWKIWGTVFNSLAEYVYSMRTIVFLLRYRELISWFLFFYFHCSFDASLTWLRPDIPKWNIGRNCALGVSPNSTRKGSARNFRRKPVFMRFPAFITSQHVQIVQITSSWTLGCFTQIEIKQSSCTIVEWVQFRNSNSKKKN